MTNSAVHYLIVPGWQGSPDTHWQSHWESVLPCASRIRPESWMQPQKADWIGALQRAIEAAPAPLILIGHSLGCITIAHWAAQADAPTLAKVRAALLVAPADVERPDCPPALQNFAPIAAQCLPFPSLLVGSSNDSAASPMRAQWLADCWGSEVVILPGVGHINVKSGHRHWVQGFAWLYRLQARCEQQIRQSA